MSKIPQPSKDFPAPGLYYSLTENKTSAIMHRDILHDLEKYIEILRVMERNKTLEAAMKAAYFDRFIHDRKLVSLM